MAQNQTLDVVTSITGSSTSNMFKDLEVSRHRISGQRVGDGRHRREDGRLNGRRQRRTKFVQLVQILHSGGQLADCDESRAGSEMKRKNATTVTERPSLLK
jgi:hypothetical protein